MWQIHALCELPSFDSDTMQLVVRLINGLGTTGLTFHL